MFNTSLIVSPLKYINNNYENISNVSNWIFNELVKSQYKDFKLKKVLTRFNSRVKIGSKIESVKLYLEIINLLVKFDYNRTIVNEFLLVKIIPLNYRNIIISLKILEVFVNNNIDIHIENELMKKTCRYGRYILFDFLINNGADVHVNDDEALQIASCVIYSINIRKVLLKNGANMDKLKKK